MANFNTIEDIPDALLETISTLGFTSMSEIQEKAINPILVLMSWHSLKQVQVKL